MFSENLAQKIRFLFISFPETDVVLVIHTIVHLGLGKPWNIALQ